MGSFQELDTVRFAPLRRAKIAAQQIMQTKTPESDTRALWDVFWKALDEIDGDLVNQFTAVPDLHSVLAHFIVEYYYLRGALVLSANCEQSIRKLTLAQAVGASAAFPPFFSAFTLPEIYDRLFVSRLALTDGGVYDNLGLAALQDEGCTHVIISDTSGLFDRRKRGAAGRASMSGRIIGIMMSAVADGQRTILHANSRQFKDLFSHKKGGQDHTDSACKYSGTHESSVQSDKEATFGDLSNVAFFHINSPSPAGPGAYRRDLEGLDLAHLRTDLDAFGDIEIVALFDRGYDLADRYVRKFMRDLAQYKGQSWQPASTSGIAYVDEDRRRKVLRAGRHRMFRSLRVPATIYSMLLMLLGLSPCRYPTDRLVSAGKEGRHEGRTV